VRPPAALRAASFPRERQRAFRPRGPLALLLRLATEILSTVHTAAHVQLTTRSSKIIQERFSVRRLCRRLIFECALSKNLNLRASRSRDLLRSVQRPCRSPVRVPSVAESAADEVSAHEALQRRASLRHAVRCSGLLDGFAAMYPQARCDSGVSAEEPMRQRGRCGLRPHCAPRAFRARGSAPFGHADHWRFCCGWRLEVLAPCALPRTHDLRHASQRFLKNALACGGCAAARHFNSGRDRC
jgi:hypothetical protein